MIMIGVGLDGFILSSSAITVAFNVLYDNSGRYISIRGIKMVVFSIIAHKVMVD